MDTSIIEQIMEVLLDYDPIERTSMIEVIEHALKLGDPRRRLILSQKKACSWREFAKSW
ncbi:hypothetical protein L873DRAFT_1801068 [Choiromyces venosus 120613-1]|uniref:Uncharacterized protein n=1 Tax=Choiromyces venosus 120613-1 TaxID=1336337 RepID=A0A3N4JYJ6_9PEZI|nr:hypothetical protein L873DRAFT_1801068 [Choiromyces venosus 120613-1]